jgi:hypothetical protein
MADATDDNDAPAAALLDYAAPLAGREPWGPVVFGPSRRSLVLLVLLGLAATWFGVRHEPWRCVGTIPGDLAVGSSPFTRDGLILTFDSGAGANLFDPATGRLVRNVLPRIDPTVFRYFVLGGGERILELPYTDRIAVVYDGRDGHAIERLPNPDGLGSQLIQVAPDGPRMLTVRTRDPRQVIYWDLTRTPPATRPVRLPGQDSDQRYSPDGRRIVETGPVVGAWWLLDGHTMAEVAGEARPTETPVRAGFQGSERFWMHWVRKPGATGSTTRPAAEVYELRAADTGALLATMPVPRGLMSAYTSSFAMTDDAGAWALVAPMAARPLVSSAGWTGQTLRVAETGGGRVLLSRDGCTSAWGLAAFPGPRPRFLVGDLVTRRLAIFSPPHAQPLAVLPGTGPFPGASLAQIAPDGQTIVTRTNPGPAGLPIPTSVVAVYRPTGWDCPESQWGVLAFPQTWLTAALLAALTLSLTADARRARGERVGRGVSRWLVGGLILLTIPLTAHALVAALLGQWVPTPAPLYWALGIFLATRARVWRGAAIVGFCGLIPLLAWCAYALRKVGLSASVTYPLLDRHYDVPVRLPAGGLAVLGVFVLAGLCLLLRPRAVMED